MRIAGMLIGHVHQDIRLVDLGVENEIDLDAMLISDDRHSVEIDPVAQLESEDSIERHRAIEIAHANADMVDPLDRDCFGAGHGSTYLFSKGLQMIHILNM